MLKRLDESKWLSKLLEKVSNFLAQYRGMPIIVGILLLLVSMIVQSVNVYTENNTLELVGVITHNIGILIALFGILMIVPLGK